MGGSRRHRLNEAKQAAGLTIHKSYTSICCFNNLTTSQAVPPCASKHVPANRRCECHQLSLSHTRSRPAGFDHLYTFCSEKPR
jgi:hypothetical protein